LKCEYVKDIRRLGVCFRDFRQIERDDSGGSNGKTAISQQRTTR
jgi:hypothetical protein